MHPRSCDLPELRTVLASLVAGCTERGATSQVPNTYPSKTGNHNGAKKSLESLERPLFLSKPQLDGAVEIDVSQKTIGNWLKHGVLQAWSQSPVSFLQVSPVSLTLEKPLLSRRLSTQKLSIFLTLRIFWNVSDSYVSFEVDMFQVLAMFYSSWHVNCLTLSMARTTSPQKDFKMTIFKKTLVALAATVAMVAAQAAPVNVAGVVFDPGSLFDFTGNSAKIFQNISASGELSGYGFITLVNDTLQSTFAPGGGELTFTFSGYMPVGPTVPVGVPGTTTNYTGGSFNVYFDSAGDAMGGPGLDAATASNGLLWLKMVGATGTSYSLSGAVTAGPALLGSGLLDVIGGAAKDYLDTNTKEGGADLAFSSSFTKFLNGNINTAFGTGNFEGDSVVPATSVPEPGSLALMGLGLVGLAAARRKRK